RLEVYFPLPVQCAQFQRDGNDMVDSVDRHEGRGAIKQHGKHGPRLVGLTEKQQPRRPDQPDDGRKEKQDEKCQKFYGRKCDGYHDMPEVKYALPSIEGIMHPALNVTASDGQTMNGSKSLASLAPRNRRCGFGEICFSPWRLRLAA